MDIVLNKPTRHVLVIHDHVIRYVKGRGSTLDELKVVRDRYLPPGTIENGVIKESETLLAILGEMKREYRLQKGDLYITLPNETNLIRRHQIPAEIPEEEIRGYIFDQLGNDLHLPMDDPLFDHCIMDDNDAEKDLLLFVSSQDVVDAYLRLFFDLKLNPEVIDFSTICIERFLENQNAHDLTGHYAIISCFPNDLVVTIFHHQYPLITRSIPTELNKEEWQVVGTDSDQLRWGGSIEDLNDLWLDNIAEIDRLLSFYQFNYRKGEGGVERIFLTGDHPQLTHFEKLFKKQIDGMTINRLDAVMGKKGMMVEPHFFEAAGLMMKGEVK
ncbi:type IV pilus biogenesis protein PilM [Salisediminibacterium beveridgei]|uniref:Type IV pilus biogenesis protein PilM n=1 Tax=Salisediminibacterium beveridgei TaxID=632773 RepID=A0A1D7QTK6_9BACI|nr:hypothetical protein [Salisediminibacterium beveridgei]AOM82356.1 Type IV pilus biogenesis protein PilM [Salisediminibacterium beveridgei]